MIYLSIDGGGSGSRARLVGEDGDLLAELQGGPANAYRDPEGAHRTVLELARRALHEAHRPESAFRELRAGIGLAGAGRPRERLRFESLGLPFPYRLVSDAELAQRGAFRGGPGTVLLAGTGTIAWSRDETGRERRAGGYGFPLADEGGGAWLGLRAVRLTLEALEEGGSLEPLTQAIEERLGGIESILAWAEQARPADYAALAPLVLHTGKTSPLAKQLLQEAGAHLERLVRSVDPELRLPVAFLGGLADGLRPYLSPSLQARLDEPLGDALEGGLQLARSLP